MMAQETTMPHSSVKHRPAISYTRPFNSRELALDALKRALKMRTDLQLSFYEPVCPFDIAHRLDIEVKLQNIPSMEGMYCRMADGPIIVLASERPAGRQNFNCAHELGHHAYEHGVSLDEMMGADQAAGNRRYADPKEFLADSFAGFLLMPKAAIDRAFTLRGLTPGTASPEEVFMVAGYLGVGYRTLITHLQCSLRLLNPARAEELRRFATKLSLIRSNITGVVLKHVTVVDEAWENRSVDLHVGDHVLVPRGWSASGAGLEEVGLTPGAAQKPGQLSRAVRQGQSELLTGDRSLAVRVARQGFHGRSRYRFLDDPEEDEGEEQ